METNVLTPTQAVQPLFLSAKAFLDHWQGQRRLTRRVIEAFPEDKLFSYSVGGMRPFANLAMEMIAMAVPGVKGVLSGDWSTYQALQPPATKQELLELWDKTTQELDQLWPLIKEERFQLVEVAFGLYEGPNYQTILYFIDNEVHHRGQGYVYLRSLGIQPPFFWER